MTEAAAPRRLVRAPFRALLVRRLGRRLGTPFPETTGNAFVPLECGEGFFDRMLRAIDGAARTVDVEMYLWHDDEIGVLFIDALARAARRGVRVRVLADAQGAKEVLGLLGAVRTAGGDVRVFNPFRVRLWRRYLTRTHKKLLLLDDGIAFTGGAGFSLDFSGGRRREQPWHDRMFEMRGPVVAQFAAVFESDFGRWRATGEPRVVVPAVPHPPDVRPGSAGAATMRVLRGWPDARDFRTLLVQAIRDARERIWIGTPYFLPPHAVRGELYRAAQRGVDVRVVIPSLAYSHPLFYHAVRARYGRYLARGVKLHEFGESFYHAKTFVSDRSVAIVGSSNLDSWSWRRNAEIDVAVTDAPTVDVVASLLAADRARSHEVTRDEARVRSFFASVKQTLASWVEDWL